MVRIGVLKYDVVADTSKFSKSMVATQKETRQAANAIRQARTPTERYAQEVKKLDNLKRKGLLTNRQYAQSLERERQQLVKNTAAAKRNAAATKRGRGGAALGAMGRLGGAIAPAIAVGAAARGIQQQIQEMDELAKTMRKLGFETSAGLLGIRDAAADLSGMASGTVDMALQRMTRRIAEAAQGTGEAQNALKELGLNAQQLAAGDPAQAFKAISDAMQGVDNQSDKLRLAFKLFDSEGAALVNTLDAGSDAITQYEQAAIDAGRARTQAELESIEELNDAWASAKRELDGIGKTIAVVAVPGLKVLAEGIAALGAAARKVQSGSWLFKLLTGGSDADFANATRGPDRWTSPSETQPAGSSGPRDGEIIPRAKEVGKEIAKAQRAPGMPPLAVRGSREEYAALARIRNATTTREHRAHQEAQRARDRNNELLNAINNKFEPAAGV